MWIYGLAESLTALTFRGDKENLHPLWNRRFSTKFNGVSYPVQRGAEAIYTERGREQVRNLIGHYLGNAEILADSGARPALKRLGT